ncbi:MAG: hypothetical protein JWP81_1187 [Ferruginibacter sp.]|nr:hypothetical protein [Ferruginibacter sp.]
MNLLFNIQSSNINASDADLYIEIDTQGLSYIILANGVCRAMLVYHFNEGTSAEAAAEYIHRVIADQPHLQQRFNRVHFIYGFAPSILIPHQFMNGTDNNDMLELVYGESSENITRTDFMYKHALHIIYTVPSVIDMVITRYFGSAEHTHLYSLLPDIVTDPETRLCCIFSTGKLTVMLMKEGKLQVIQQYNYKTQDDVAYYLLNICKSYEADVQAVAVHLFGMIDENSALYTELYKYFPRLQFEALPAQYQYPDEIHQYPAHYFSHLFALAACV